MRNVHRLTGAPLTALLLLSLAACSDSAGQDDAAPPDAGAVTGAEAGPDQGRDAGQATPDQAMVSDSIAAVDGPTAPDLAATPDAMLAPDMGPKGLSCTPPACPPCYFGKQGCATKGPFLQGTCCAKGDALSYRGNGKGFEGVDLETNGKYAIVCGGFGADISDVTNPAMPKHLGTLTKRCQRAAFGPLLKDGTQVFYLAHHGDTHVSSPFLGTYVITPKNKLNWISVLKSSTRLFEGLLYHNNTLYVAAHKAGIEIFKVDASGGLTHHGLFNGGIKNAWKLAAHKDRLFVADQKAGLMVFSLAQPLAPKWKYTVKTTSSPRDVALREGKRAYVALGGAGVDVFDISGAGAPKLIKNMAVQGSTQAVDVDGDVLALANWNHVALHDATSLALLATEKLTQPFQQDLAVALHQAHVFVGEWNGMHVLRYNQGLVAPDMFINEELFTLAPGTKYSRAVKVTNLGQLDLKVSSVTVSDPAFKVKNGSFTIKPGKADVFEFSYQPPTKAKQVTLQINSNDPDAIQAKLKIPILLNNSNKLDVGDTLPASFGFLDPKGAGQVSALKGKVVVLTYFALF